MAWPACTATSAERVAVHVSIPPLYTGLVKLRMVVLPYLKVAVIFGLAGMVPLEIVTYVVTLMVPALITKLSHNAGAMVNVVLVVPTVLSRVVLAVVISAVFTGST